MKLILTWCFAAIMPMIYPSTDVSVNNGSINSPAYTLNHITAGNEDFGAFKENKILISEFADIIKDHGAGLMSSGIEKTKRKDLMKRVEVD